MDFQKWATSELKYGGKILHSGLDGFRAGRRAFFHGGQAASFFREASRNAWKPAVFGACAGMVGAYPGHAHKSVSRMLAFGFLGSLVGFGSGLAWMSRGLAASIAAEAWRSLGKVRDEHWLEKHPIDYA